MTFNNKQSSPKKATSWEPVGNWYNDLVGSEGHYYHRQIIMPGVLRLLSIKEPRETTLLDLGCGQGILARHLPKELHYTGVDLSETLIKAANQGKSSPNQQFLVGDLTNKLTLPQKNFHYATIILALQNIERGDKVVQNAKQLLAPNGKLLIVLNHPCFRIPRQSSWQVDDSKKIQYRRIDRYFSELKVPIQMHPGKGSSSPSTWSFHHSLTTYSQWLADAGFQIAKIEEWCSDKVSSGSKATMENRSRSEIPLFMALLAVKS
jgi:ubiquinone/menaquinone biosynthesis C-methylase UbiE